MGVCGLHPEKNPIVIIVAKPTISSILLWPVLPTKMTLCFLNRHCQLKPQGPRVPGRQLLLIPPIFLKQAQFQF